MSLPGGSEEFTKTAYDGLEDPTNVYVGYDPNLASIIGTPAAYTEAQGVSAFDVILTQTDTQFNATGYTIFATTFDRYDDAPATATGGLDALGAAYARASYVAYWPDGIGRTVATTDYGAAPVVPPSGGPAPTCYDPTGLTRVTLTDFNARGEAYETIDPAGNIRLTTDDDAGRTIETIQNYSTTIGADTNITTDTAFNAGTDLVSTTSVTTEKADLSGTQTQVTADIYGSWVGVASPAIYRGDLLRAVVSGLTPSDNLASVFSAVASSNTAGLKVVEYADIARRTIFLSAIFLSLLKL